MGILINVTDADYFGKVAVLPLDELGIMRNAVGMSMRLFEMLDRRSLNVPNRAVPLGPNSEIQSRLIRTQLVMANRLLLRLLQSHWLMVLLLLLICIMNR